MAGSDLHYRQEIIGLQESDVRTDLSSVFGIDRAWRMLHGCSLGFDPM